MNLRDITKLHTKQLMAIREAFFSGGVDGKIKGSTGDRIAKVGYNQGYEGWVHSIESCALHPDTACVSMDELKAELAKRPHVPNKKEARAIRQKRAQT